MQNTVNLNLKKPDQNDFVNIGDINDNMDILDAEVAKKYVKPLAGIPSLDLDSATQAALKKAETALQSVTKASVGLGNVDNTSDVNKPVSTAQKVALDKKANLASPILTGTPTAPTAAESTNTQQIATTAFVDRAVKTHQADLVSHGIYGVATGTNALVMTDSKVTSYVDGMLVAFKNTTASTASTTLNINSLGAKAIVKANGTAVNNLKANAIYQLRYNGVNFTLLGEGGEYGNVTAADVRSTKTFGTENGVVQGALNLSQLISSNIKKGVTIDGVDGSLDITSLGGKRWASGTVISSSSNFYFLTPSNNATSAYILSVTGLSFIPSFVIITSTNASSFTLYKRSGFYYGGGVAITGSYPENTDSVYQQQMKEDGTYLKVTSTSFSLPVSLPGRNYNWIAYE